ncbi:hypothetical protein NW762_013416 [Fusarium torreyae]|uniref:Transmembrane protein n=1 Tax=Fusarium torreyae TaxID=1237075 RepID=A0A9W8VAE2_9HYPO|nr:hypothetical protein NW762_013416 [Fusarium torreyae]
MTTLLVGYVVVAVLNFIHRIARITNGECYIGMEKISMIPLIAFDFVINIYLTILFLIPLKNLYSFSNQPNGHANCRLRSLALRTFIGACCTLTSSIINLTVVMVLNGEPGWVCLMCCSTDVLFSAIVIQWITSQDNDSFSSQVNSSGRVESSYGSRSTAHHMNHFREMRAPNAVNHGNDNDDEINLVTLSRATCSTDISSDIKKVYTNGGVLVTTTIHSNTRSTAEGRESRDEDDITVVSEGQAPTRASVYTPGITDSVYSPQTSIQGGRWS